MSMFWLAVGIVLCGWWISSAITDVADAVLDLASAQNDVATEIANLKSEDNP